MREREIVLVHITVCVCVCSVWGWICVGIGVWVGVDGSLPAHLEQFQLLLLLLLVLQVPPVLAAQECDSLAPAAPAGAKPPRGFGLPVGGGESVRGVFSGRSQGAPHALGGGLGRTMMWVC